MPEASVQIIGRMAQLMEAVASAGSAGLRLTDAVAATGLGKTTAHRLFTALAEIGYVVHDAGTRAYRIGPAIGRLAAMGDARDLASVAAPVLRDLARETQDTVFLSVRDGSEAICIAREVGRIEFAGNRVTRPEVLARELTQRRGEICSLDDVIDGIQSLMDLGLFRSVRAELELERRPFAVGGGGSAGEVLVLRYIVREKLFFLAIPRLSRTSDGELSFIRRLFGNIGGISLSQFTDQ